MAVVELQTADDRGVLAVDSSRLPAVALWPASYGTQTAESVAGLLRTQPVSHTTVQASELRVTVTLDAVDPAASPTLTLQLGRPSGDAPALLKIDSLLPGTNTYSLPTPDCADAPASSSRCSSTLDRRSATSWT